LSDEQARRQCIVDGIDGWGRIGGCRQPVASGYQYSRDAHAQSDSKRVSIGFSISYRKEGISMSKLIVTICLATLLAGAALYVGGKQVAPGVVTKGTAINTALTTATVNTTSGTATITAP
jgi:hypothetical protein